MDPDYLYRSYISSLSISLIVMLVIFIAYTVIHDLKNFQGKIIRAYVISESGFYASSLGTIVLYYHLLGGDFSGNAIMAGRALDFLVITKSYCRLSSIFWLLAMSFDVWGMSRIVRPVESHNENCNRKRFIWYAIFAWVTPAILYPITYFSINSSAHTGRLAYLITRWTSITISMVCTICLYIATAVSIKQQKNRIANLDHDVNDQHNANKQWLSLQLKLFLLMTSHVGYAAISEIVKSEYYLPMLYGPLLVLKSILTSVVLLWNNEVKKWLREQRNR